MLNLGEQKIKGLFLEEQEIPKAYLGDDLVFENAPSYTVSASIDPAGSGTVIGAGQYKEGAQATISATAADGYEFVQWVEHDGSRLPDGYTELEYIETDNRTRIGTGFHVDEPMKTRIVMDITPLEKVSAYRYLFTAIRVNSSVLPAIMLRQNNAANQMYYMVGLDGVLNSGGNGTFAYNLAVNTRVTVDMDIPSSKIKVGSSVFSISPNPAIDNYEGAGELYVGTIPQVADVADSYTLKCKMYALKTYVDEVLSADLVPCKAPDGSIGLYDLVSGNFMAPTLGAPTAGPKAPGTTGVVSTDAEYTFTVTGDRTLVAEFAAVPSSRLPEGYTELEFVKNPNLGYIILNTLNPIYTKTWFAEVKVELTVSDLASSGNVNLMGSYIRYSGNYWCASLLYYSNSYNRYYLLQGQTASVSSSSKNISVYIAGNRAAKVTITIDRPITQLFCINDTQKVISGAYIAPTNNLRDPVILGSYGKVGASTPIGYSYTFYGLKVYDASNQLVSDIVPAMKSDGTIGLFDIVTGVFSAPPNATLVAGPAV